MGDKGNRRIAGCHPTRISSFSRTGVYPVISGSYSDYKSGRFSWGDDEGMWARIALK